MTFLKTYIKRSEINNPAQSYCKLVEKKRTRAFLTVAQCNKKRLIFHEVYGNFNLTKNGKIMFFWCFFYIVVESLCMNESYVGEENFKRIFAEGKTWKSLKCALICCISRLFGLENLNLCTNWNFKFHGVPTKLNFI